MNEKPKGLFGEEKLMARQGLELARQSLELTRSLIVRMDQLILEVRGIRMDIEAVLSENEYKPIHIVVKGPP